LNVTVILQIIKPSSQKMEKHSCSFLIRAVAGGTTHIIIAISTMYSLILRQNKTDKKSNESTLIQNLLT
ncbi:hypothetical protein NU283_21840, partial [Escherichia coli]|uniref:hypothetical protein n=1 Tax=Escherichia coli TaxID=562 RepID=UPI002150ADE2